MNYTFTLSINLLITALFLSVTTFGGYMRGTTTSGVQDNSYWLEAECAEIGGRWYTVADTAASGGNYVVTQFASSTVPADVPLNRVRFTLADPVLGKRYTIYARVNTPNRVTDSYYVRVNEGPWIEKNKGFDTGTGFNWIEATTADLQAGVNTIDFAYRESNTGLDKILVTDQPSLPTGFGAAVQTCTDNPPPPPVDKRIFWLEAECAIVGSSFLTVEDPSAAGGAYVSAQKSIVKRMPLDVPSNRIRFIVDNPDVESGPFTIWLKPVGSKIYGRYFVRVNGGPWMYQGINGNVFPGSMWRKSYA